MDHALVHGRLEKEMRIGLEGRILELVRSGRQFDPRDLPDVMNYRQPEIAFQFAALTIRVGGLTRSFIDSTENH